MAQAGADGSKTSTESLNGYDSIARGVLTESAVLGETRQGGGRSTARVRVCESTSELARALDIDASLSVSYLKAANVTAKMNFMKQLNATSRSVTIVVYASHQTGTWTASNVKLAPGIVLPEDVGDFVADYGDSYVSSVTEGAEYYGVYTFHTETETEQKALTASLKFGGEITGTKVDGDIQTKLTDFLKRTSTNWSFDQEITGLANPRLPKEDELIAFAAAFIATPIDSPVTTGFKVSGYEGVPGIGRRRLAKIVENRDHFLADDGVLRDYQRLQGLQNQIKWLKRIYARYDYTGDKTLVQFEKEVKADIGKINKQITAYKADPNGDFDALTLPSLDRGEPVLTYQIGQTPSFGGEGAGPFDFMPVGEALRNQVKIASIRLFVDPDGEERTIHKIEIGYASDRTKWMTSHGGNGKGKELFELKDENFPTRFVINSDRYVDRFEMHLNDKRMTFAGGKGGKDNVWSVPAGSVVLGFAGRAGALLDQIKIVYATLQPAVFKEPIV